VSEPLVERDEIVAPLVNVSDIAASLARIQTLLENEGEETEADG
jgi:hypothetical protein